MGDGLQIRANLYNFADSFRCVFTQTMPISPFVRGRFTSKGYNHYHFADSF